MRLFLPNPKHQFSTRISDLFEQYRIANSLNLSQPKKTGLVYESI